VIEHESPAEREILELLRARYLADGFRFIIHPPRDLTPSFLGSYRPDAIALKGSGGVVFEVKKSSRSGSGRGMAEIARLFEGHPEWRLEFVFADNFTGERGLLMGAASFEPLSDEQLASMRSEVELLSNGGHSDAALIMSWALLEATARRRLGSAAGALQMMTGWQVVEQLATRGLLDPERVPEMQELLGLRNAVAHGAQVRRVSSEDVRAMLRVIDEISQNEPA
jgi:uncharacterized protein YutE (UPF0331/DUF86 family)